MAPVAAGIHGLHLPGKFRVFLRIGHGHLSLPYFRILAAHPVAAEANCGDNGGHLGHIKFLAEIVDQVNEVFLVFRLGLLRATILVPLPPDESGDLVALVLVTGNNLIDLVECFAHAFDHQAILQTFPLVGAFGTRLTA